MWNSRAVAALDKSEGASVSRWIKNAWAASEHGADAETDVVGPALSSATADSYGSYYRETERG